MGFGFDLVTSVQNIEDKSGHYIVDVVMGKGPMMRRIKVTRARARAMIATGVVENVGNRTRDIAQAIRELDFDEINRSTEIVSGEQSGDVVTVKVYK